MKEPLYSVVASRVEDDIIRTGKWAPGDRLPPERELCQLLGVSRATIRLALDELENRSLISRHQGRGTYVRRKLLDSDFFGFFTIGAAMSARGMHLGATVRTVEVIEASRQSAQDLGLVPGDPVVHLERLRTVADEPLMIENTYLPGELFPGLESKDLSGRGLYDVLRKDFDTYPSDASEAIEPVITTPAEAALLQTPRNSPALLIRRSTRDQRGRDIELTHAIMRGDQCRYFLIRHLRDGSLPDSIGEGDNPVGSAAR